MLRSALHIASSLCGILLCEATLLRHFTRMITDLTSELANNITRCETFIIISGTAVAPLLFGAEQQNRDRRLWFAYMRRCGQTTSAIPLS